MADDREHVIDANVFIHGSANALPFPDPITVPAVTAELESVAAQTRFDVESIPVFEPSSAAVDAVRTAAEEQGEELSAADVQVIALARDRDAVVVSDDYGVQNVARALDVAFTGFQQDETTETVAWKRVCADCGRDVDGDQCPVCGGAVKRVSR